MSLNKEDHITINGKEKEEYLDKAVLYIHNTKEIKH